MDPEPAIRVYSLYVTDANESAGRTASWSVAGKDSDRGAARDQAVDDFYDSIFRTLLTHMMENPHNIGQAAHLLFVAKNLERVGDHATNIAEMVYYAATGDHMVEPPKRKKRRGAA